LKQIVVSSENNQITVAVLEDKRLVEIIDDSERESRYAGSIFRGKVINVVPGIQAAFVDIGLGKNAFLYVADVIKSIYEEEEKNPPSDLPAIENLLKEGQEVIVQVIREGAGDKGARVTANLSLAGRYVVLLLGDNQHLGVSRKITAEEERRRLYAWGQKAKPPDTGMIIRTLAEGVSEEDLLEDVIKLGQVKEEIRYKIENSRAKGLLYGSNDPFSRLMREVIDDEVDEIIIDDGDLAAGLRKMLKEINFPAATKVWTDLKGDLFERYDINHQLRYALQPKVELKNGGYLIIERTEALTAIDVNSGKYTGKKNLQETILDLNLQAANEVSRQIRLRNLSGIIIVDFVDLDNKDDWDKVLEQLETAFRRDRVKCRVMGLTKLGLVEITRKKEGQTLEVS